MEEREKLLNEIEALEERETYYQQQVDSATEEATKDAFAKELADTQAKIAAKKEQLEQLDNASAKAQGDLYSQFDNIVIGENTLTLRELATNEQAYQILNMWFQQYVGDMAQQNAVIVSSYQSQVSKLQEDVSELENLRKTNVDLTDKLADMETKRDAAAAALAEAQEEAKRLAADNESLRKQLETSNKPLQTNSNTDLAALAKQFNETKPAIYNKRWEDELTKKYYLAELATTGETIRFGYLEAGKYREVSPAEAETFREQTPEVEEPVQSEPVQDQSLVEPPPSIPSEEDAAVPADTTDGEVDTEAVSRVEYEALKARVEKIERTLNIEVAA